MRNGSVVVTNGVNSPYTAVNGDIVMGDVGSGGGGTIIVNLPLTPATGDTVTVMDTSGTGGFFSNNCTVGRNGEPINGIAGDDTLAVNNQSVTYIYTNATKGWIYQSTNQ